MVIKQELVGGKSVFTFTARKTGYSIIEAESSIYGDNAYTVYTQRGRYPTPPRVMTLAEMLAGSNQTLKGFAQVVAA